VNGKQQGEDGVQRIRVAKAGNRKIIKVVSKEVSTSVMRRARRLEARNGNTLAQKTTDRKQAATAAQWERQYVAMRNFENPRSREERRKRSRKKEAQNEQQNGGRLMVITKVEVGGGGVGGGQGRGRKGKGGRL
jgi:hypothetical protein